MADIEIIFLTYNRLKFSKKSLPALLDSDPDMDYNVTIWDNGSTDGTVEWLKTLSHPRIKTIHYNKTNLGIAPVTNRFWKESKATYIGKIDNDLIVPKGWIKEVMLRLENAPQENIGSVTLYHWPKEWISNTDHKKIPIIELQNGSKLALSSHTGGNYIFHRYLLDKLGFVKEDYGLKAGYTRWQWNKKWRYLHGYIYPFNFFQLPEHRALWEEYESGKLDENSKHFMLREIKDAKNLLEFPISNFFLPKTIKKINS